ncbi:MAG: glucans biosynthesis glucosyltransferase MdoH [Thalassobaculaceae bacterium]|nr:glucans biosynthesis glucosyltransferase MdoH [Thalassobaculaceae bacterium]
MSNQNRDYPAASAVGQARTRPLILSALCALLTAALTVTITLEFDRFLSISLHGAYKWLLLGLFVVLTTWISANFCQSLIGTVSLLAGRRRGTSPSDRVIGRRLAVVIPIYEEDPEAVHAGLEQVFASLSTESRLNGFHLFILSDSRKDETIQAEIAACRHLRLKFDAADRIFYRQRKDNRGRKAGNIQDFVETWGGAYEFALVLDADSRMDGPAVQRLADELDGDPQLGLVQTWVRPVRGTTPFGRMQQFATSVYGQASAEGVRLLMGDSATYWGHNAMMRVQAFAECCGLAELPGHAPLGGEILSHDFVEAAMLRRGGWKVKVVADRLGSFEEPPPSLLAHAARDRRWCQGNLQHIQLLVADGIGWTNRLHFFMGALAYLASPIWMMFLVVGAVGLLSTAPGLSAISEAAPVSLPSDVHVDPWLLVAIPLGMLFLPKVIGTLLTMADPVLRRGHGGVLALFFSMLAEMVFSTLNAPVMMLLHTRFVGEIIAGASSGWKPGKRTGEQAALVDVLSAHGVHMMIGVVAAAAIGWASLEALAIASPVIAGLILSAPLTMAGSSPALGAAMRRVGLYLIPEEVHPPKVLTDGG